MTLSEYHVRYPDNSDSLDQNEEWITLIQNDKQEKIRLHDYDRFFEVPGLYEEVVYKELKCCSPVTICSLLYDKLAELDKTERSLRVLDFGAGNGMIGECLQKTIGCETLVGLDIIPQARDAAMRDYPGIYNDYLVMDLARLDSAGAAQLKKYRFNVLITVAALGFGDIPTLAFLNAFNLIEKNGWIAFNIKERFVSQDDETGYQKIIDHLSHNCMDKLSLRRYCHRLSLSGKPLYYYAAIGRKTSDIASPEEIVRALHAVPN